MATRLFNSKFSMFCEKIRVVLNMKKVPYDVVDVRADERKSLIEFSNQRKVPTMDFDGRCIQDSTILASYLEEKHPEPTIYPDNPSDKGLCLMLEDWADEDLNGAVMSFRRAKTEEDVSQAEKGLAVHLENLDLLYSGRDFVFGQMTLADISIYAQLHYLYTSLDREIDSGYTNVHAFIERMMKATGVTSIKEVAA
jgi:glutathione S-transferase